MGSRWWRMPQFVKLSCVMSSSPLPNTFFQGCDELGQHCWGAGDLNVVDMFGSDEVKASIAVTDDQLVVCGARSGAEDIVRSVGELDAETAWRALAPGSGLVQWSTSRSGSKSSKPGS